MSLWIQGKKFLKHTCSSLYVEVTIGSLVDCTVWVSSLLIIVGTLLVLPILVDEEGCSVGIIWCGIEEGGGFVGIISGEPPLTRPPRPVRGLTGPPPRPPPLMEVGAGAGPAVPPGAAGHMT